MEKVTNLNIFETNAFDGPMRLKYEYFPEITEGVSKRKITDEMTEEMKEEFLKIRQTAGKKYGFDGTKIIVPCEEDSEKTGSYFIADEKVYGMDSELWNVDIPGDIVLLKEENPGIVIAYPVADDPVLILEDSENKITALTHCNVRRISKKMPLHAIKALEQEAGSNPENLMVYIGTHIKRDSNTCLRRPKEIMQYKEIWKKCVTHKRDETHKKQKVKKMTKIDSFLIKMIEKMKYKIDMEKAIINMLLKAGVKEENIIVSKTNTFKSPIHYSEARDSILKEDCLKGKFLVGAYYENTFPDYDSTCPYIGKPLTKKLVKQEKEKTK